jgi:hypothetical protein
MSCSPSACSVSSSRVHNLKPTFDPAITNAYREDQVVQGHRDGGVVSAVISEGAPGLWRPTRASFSWIWSLSVRSAYWRSRRGMAHQISARLIPDDHKVRSAWRLRAGFISYPAPTIHRQREITFFSRSKRFQASTGVSKSAFPTRCSAEVLLMLILRIRTRCSLSPSRIFPQSAPRCKNSGCDDTWLRSRL